MGMKRKMFAALEAHLPKKEFTILTGARQTGKSTLLKQLEFYCKSKSYPCLFINLEDKNILAELNENPRNIFKYFSDHATKTTILIDEIQYLKDPSNFLKLLYDEHAEQIKIVASGSSAFYMDDKFKDSLAGRKRVFQLLTCSFDEYLQLREKEDLLNEVKRITVNPDGKTTQLGFIKMEWDNFMVYGGYPSIITEENPAEKIERLKEIRDSFIKRDILESGVQNEAAFYNLFRLLAGQSGGLINVNELGLTLRIKNDTVQNYLSILQKCFHVAIIKPFYGNLRKELIKMPKTYLLDTGLRNCLINNFEKPDNRMDKGELWENTFFRILADVHGIDAINFWRTTEGNEVDFVLPEIATPLAVETKYNEALIKQSKYKKFIETYPSLPLHFAWMFPFDESFFRRIAGSTSG
jgi:uncharacterized protein